MSFPGKDLSFDEARVVYSAWINRCEDKPQAQVFGELTLDQKKVVVRAMHVLEENLDKLSKHPDDVVRLSQPGFVRLAEVVKTISGRVNLNDITNQTLLAALRANKEVVTAGKAQVVLTNRFIDPYKFLDAMKGPNGKNYTELMEIARQNIPTQEKKERAQQVVKDWVDTLVVGEGKKAAEEGLKAFTSALQAMTDPSGLNEGNIQTLTARFEKRTQEAMLEAWKKEGITTTENRAMGIGALGLAPFLSSRVFDAKTKEVEEVISQCRKVLPELGQLPKEGAEGFRRSTIHQYQRLENEILPYIRYPQYAALYANLLQEHAHMLKSLGGVEERAVELEELSFAFAMYACVSGNPEGAIIMAKGLLDYGDWSLKSVNETMELASFFAKKAVELAQKGGGTVLRRARLLEADILKKRYFVAKKLGFESADEPVLRREERANVPTYLNQAVTAYGKLGSDGIGGLYELFLEGASKRAGDLIVEQLERKLYLKQPLFRPKPTFDEIRILTTIALSGNANAETLVRNLRGLDEKSPELLNAIHLVEHGTFSNPNKGLFTFDAACKCYREAIRSIGTEVEAHFDAHVQIAAHHLTDGEARLGGLKHKYDAFLRDLQPGQNARLVVQAYEDTAEDLLRWKEPGFISTEPAPAPAAAAAPVLVALDQPEPPQLSVDPPRPFFSFENIRRIGAYLLSLVTPRARGAQDRLAQEVAGPQSVFDPAIDGLYQKVLEGDLGANLVYTLSLKYPVLTENKVTIEDWKKLTVATLLGMADAKKLFQRLLQNAVVGRPTGDPLDRALRELNSHPREFSRYLKEFANQIDPTLIPLTEEIRRKIPRQPPDFTLPE